MLLDGLEVCVSGLADVIDGANGEAPWVSVIQGRAVASSPTRRMCRFTEERLPRYVNTAVDYGSIQQAVVGGQKIQVIDDFLTPEALEQVRKFCLESTVWRHPYNSAMSARFLKTDSPASSLFAIAEEFSAALGDAFDGFQFAAVVGASSTTPTCREPISTATMPISR